MAKPAVRLQALEVALLVGLGAVVLRAAQVQILQGGRYSEEARAQRTVRLTLEARRGGLYDRDGTAIALTQESYHVGVAPNELRDPLRDAAAIAAALHLPPQDVRAALRKRYAYFGGPFSALEVQRIRALRGVHLDAGAEAFLSLSRPSPAPSWAGWARMAGPPGWSTRSTVSSRAGRAPPSRSRTGPAASTNRRRG